LYHQTQSCAAQQSLGMIHNVLSGLICCFVWSLDLKIQFSLYGCARRPLLGYTFVQLGNILHEVNLSPGSTPFGYVYLLKWVQHC
jgi:hypothetical protein